MKILFYENSLGFTSYTHALCNAVYNHDDQNEIIYLKSMGKLYSDQLEKTIRVLEVLEPYRKIKRYSPVWLTDRVYKSIKNIKLRNNIVKQMKPDIVSIQSTIPIFDQYFFSSLKRHSKVLLTVHDVIPPVESFYWSKGSLRNIYKKANHLIVHSSMNKDQLCNEFSITPEKVSVIHHGTKTNYPKLDVDKCKANVGVNNGKNSILFYGSIRKQKGFDLLIKALKGIDCNLIVAGAVPFGDSFDRYDKLIEDNGVNCIKYIEYILEEFTNELFQACELVVLPYTYFYSQSGVFMQAIQYGKPVVASDVGCFKEYIEKYNIGQICRANDIDDLHNTIKRVIGGKHLPEYTRNAAIAAHENSWEKSAELHFKLFRRIMHDQG